jgi:hypothetical protein
MGGSPERAGGDEGGAPTGQASDAMDVGVSSVSARLIASRVVARCRASLDMPAAGRPSIKRS